VELVNAEDAEDSARDAAEDAEEDDRDAAKAATRCVKMASSSVPPRAMPTQLRSMSLHDRFELARALAREEIAQRLAVEREHAAKAVAGAERAMTAVHPLPGDNMWLRWPPPTTLAQLEQEVAAVVASCLASEDGAPLDDAALRDWVAAELVRALDDVCLRAAADVVGEVDAAIAAVASGDLVPH